MRTVRVLLLDYDAALIQTLHQLFTFEGFEVTVCRTVDQLTRRVLHDPRSVVVADWCEVCLGDELQPQQLADIEEVAQHCAGVVLTSGHTWATYAPPRFVADVVVLAKPFDLDTLLQAVKSMACAAAARHDP